MEKLIAKLKEQGLFYTTPCGTVTNISNRFFEVEGKTTLTVKNIKEINNSDWLAFDCSVAAVFQNVKTKQIVIHSGVSIPIEARASMGLVESNAEFFTFLLKGTVYKVLVDRLINQQIKSYRALQTKAPRPRLYFSPNKELTCYLIYDITIGFSKPLFTINKKEAVFGDTKVEFNKEIPEALLGRVNLFGHAFVDDNFLISFKTNLRSKPEEYNKQQTKALCINVKEKTLKLIEPASKKCFVVLKDDTLFTLNKGTITNEATGELRRASFLANINELSEKLSVLKPEEKDALHFDQFKVSDDHNFIGYLINGNQLIRRKFCSFGEFHSDRKQALLISKDKVIKTFTVAELKKLNSVLKNKNTIFTLTESEKELIITRQAVELNEWQTAYLLALSDLRTLRKLETKQYRSSYDQKAVLLSLTKEEIDKGNIIERLGGKRHEV